MNWRKLKLSKVIAEDSYAGWVIDPGLRVDIGVDRLHKPSSHQYLHWSLSDPVANTIEVDVDRNSGELMSVAIIFGKASIIHPLTSTQETEPAKNAVGFPSFNLDMWAPSIKNNPAETDLLFYDYPGRCRFEIGEQELHVILFPDVVSYHITTNDHKLRCEFNMSNELCGITMNNLDPAERAMFEETVRV